MLRWPVHILSKTNVLFWTALSGLIAYVLYILMRFNFQYTDMDQVLMWYGASEFRSGDFHMVRYFGQNYGTMLEGLLGSLLIGIPYHIALPIVTCSLLLLPYALIGKTSTHNWKWLLPVGFLLLFPPEFFMLGSMPRDFVTGIALTSLALPLLNRRTKWSYFFIGFICILGWSIQQNAALFGAVVSVYAVWKNDRICWKGVIWVGLGYAMGAMIHVLVSQYYTMHDEFIVHHAWDFHYAWKQVWDGWKNLDRHFAWITPAAQYQGWFYILIFSALLIWTYLKKAWPLFFAAVALAVITFASFGVLKIHDARDNVFFSHERMFLALPVTILFIVSRIKTTLPISQIFAVIGLILLPFSFYNFDSILAFNLNEERDHVVKVRSADQFYSDCEQLQDIALKYDVPLMIFGPNYGMFDVVSTHGCQSVVDDLMLLFPDYERKTWEMRKVVDQNVQRFIWHITGDVKLDNRMINISGEIGVEGLYLVQLTEGNAIDFYKSKGHSVRNY